MGISDTNYWDALERVLDTYPYNCDMAGELNWFNSLSRIQQVLFPTHYLCAEVYNGGFHQYFHNSTGLTAPEAVSGFRELGLGDVAELVARAMNIFGTEYPREREKRQNFLDNIPGDEPSEWNPFFALDDEFYSLIAIPGGPPFSGEDRFTIAAHPLVAESP